jgi:hypothetical protein
MKQIFSIFAIISLAGCVSLHEPAPAGYAGPTSQVADSGFLEDGRKAQLFVIQEVDSKTINNSIIETRRASQGHGFSLTPRYIARAVPATPMKAKLVGTHQTAAPIHEFASRAAGTFFSVEGIVDFVPIAGRNYAVKGELKKEGSSVWIEDVATNQPVTEKVRSNP